MGGYYPPGFQLDGVYNPSVSFADSSICTREPDWFTLSVKTFGAIILTEPLFYTKNRRRPVRWRQRIENANFRWCLLSPYEGDSSCGSNAGVGKLFFQEQPGFFWFPKEMGLYLYKNFSGTGFTIPQSASLTAPFAQGSLPGFYSQKRKVMWPP